MICQCGLDMLCTVILVKVVNVQSVHAERQVFIENGHQVQMNRGVFLLPFWKKAIH